MSVKRWVVRSLLGWGLFVSSSSGGAIAQSPIPEPSPILEPAPSSDTGEVSPIPAADLWTYTLPKNFSLQIPESWTVEGTAADSYAEITNYSQDRPEGEIPQLTDIRTEVTLVEEHPDSFVSRELATLIDQEYPVQRYTPVRVNDRTALRLWITDLPQEYSRQIITFVGYASYGTAMIVTYYNDDTTETAALIEQIHNSFELVF